MNARSRLSRPQGFTLMEVLVTLVLLAFGILGLINLQTKLHVAEMDSYQRAQAVLLLEDMVSRINANRNMAASYVTASYLGVGDSKPASCVGESVGAARDTCEWSNSLKGAAEQDGTTNVGAMVGARGCIEQIQAANPGAGICTPGIYRVTVAWQGLTQTIAPSVGCARNLYGADDYRRAVSQQVTIGLPRCVP